MTNIEIKSRIKQALILSIIILLGMLISESVCAQNHKPDQPSFKQDFTAQLQDPLAAI